jgi:ankyrin repeat protein
MTTDLRDKLEEVRHLKREVARLEKRIRVPLADELIKAVESKKIAAAKFLLDAGADPNSRNSDQQPILHLAVSLAPPSVSLVRALLQARADIDSLDDAGNTALILCVADVNLSVVRALIKHGANVNARNDDGDTPLTNAACWGSRKVLKYLLAHGADIHLADGIGVTAAELARQHGHGAVVELLNTSI